MKKKVSNSVVWAALAGGAVGILVGVALPSMLRPVSPRLDAPDSRVAQLVATIEARDAEIEEMRFRISECERHAAGSAPSAEPGDTGERPPSVDDAPAAETLSASPAVSRREQTAATAFGVLCETKPTFDIERARAKARELGVTEESLQVALHAYSCLTNKADPADLKQALDALMALRDGRSASVAALVAGLDGGPLASPGLRRLMEASMAPGYESLFVDVVRDLETSSWARTEVVRHMDVADSPATRDYLVERMEGEEDRYFAATLAITLVQLCVSS